MSNLAVVAGVTLAMAGLTLVLRAGRALALFEQAGTWQSVPGEVIDSRLCEAADSDGVAYRAEITCAYTVDGRRCTTTRHTQGMPFQHQELAARALVAAFPVGKAVELRLDPSALHAAVLVTGEPMHMHAIRRIGQAAILGGIGLALVDLFARVAP